MDNFNLRKYLAENKLIKEETSKVLSENQLNQIEDWKFQDGWGFIEDYRREDEKGINKNTNRFIIITKRVTYVN